MFVLTADIDEGFPKLGQHGQTRQVPVDVHPVLPAPGDNPSQHQVVFVRHSPGHQFRLQTFMALEMKQGLHGGALGGGTDHVGRRPISQQETDRPHDNGLPGPGFTGEDVHAFTERYVQGIDDGEISDGKFS